MTDYNEYIDNHADRLGETDWDDYDLIDREFPQDWELRLIEKEGGDQCS